VTSPSLPTDPSRWLSDPDTLRLLSTYNLPVIAHRLATSSQEAARAAQDMGCPVAAKVVAPGLIHKSDVGGVRLDILTPDEAAAAFAATGTISSSLLDAAATTTTAKTTSPTVAAIPRPKRPAGGGPP